MMTGRVIEILPFGLLPIFLFLGWAIWWRASDSAEKNVVSKIRSGITEYPHDISWVLNEYHLEDIVFTEDGKSVVVAVDKARERGLIDEASARKKILEQIHYAQDELDTDLLVRHVISSVCFDPDQDTAKIVITLPDEVVRSQSYIDREMSNIGRVFSRNLTNGVRWLQYPEGERCVEHGDGRIVVRIDRRQIVPGFLETKPITMSERQISRNIKNRLWNRVDVRCVSIDAKTYCGEILLR